MIRNPVITKGGGSFPRDPVEFYKTTRPADWLPMPAPADDEIYLLFHIPEGASSLVAFTVTCSGSYTVALGTVSGGAFAERSRTSVAGGSKYENELFAGDWGDLTSDGYKQVMIKVSGTDLLTWKISAHTKKPSPVYYASWNIVEIACRMPKGTSVGCGTSSAAFALRALRYFAWYGTNELITTGGMFGFCESLLAVLALDTSKATSIANLFYNCYSLRAIPKLNTSKVTGFGSLFRNCIALEAVPEMDTSNATNVSGMFYCCQTLISVPALDFSKATNMNSTFYQCLNLRTIPALDTSSAVTFNNLFCNDHSLSEVPMLNTASITNMNGMFTSVHALSSFKLDPTVTGWAGVSLSLGNCSLGHDALVELFNSLPTITSSQELTLTGNPGVSELTDGEKAIATGKNWTLTL